MSAQRARLRALQGFRDEAKNLGERYYHLKHDTYLNWRWIFGKSFGDLPNVAWLRPFAVTGAASSEIAATGNSTVLDNSMPGDSRLVHSGPTPSRIAS
jgi:hypothetical protein